MQPIKVRSAGMHAWMKYAGLTAQLLAGLAAAMLLGWWIDGLTGTKLPWSMLLLPVCWIVWMLVWLLRDTKPENNN
jgi:chromate transport protein ChrA